MKKIDKILKELAQLYDFYKEIAKFKIMNKKNPDKPIRLNFPLLDSEKSGELKR